MSGPAIVLGAGLAGSLCALRLRSLGVPVLLVADRPGATLMHGGGWLLGASLDEDLREGLAFARVALPGLGLREGPFELPDTEGAVRTCGAAPASHAAFAAFGSRVGVVDLANTGHPFASMQRRGTPVAVDWPAGSGAFGRSFAALAHAVDADPALIEGLIAALKTALSGRAFDGLFLPPVLGLRRVETHRQALESALGVSVAEALDTLPSTPGFRLSAALDDALAAAGVERRAARVTSVSVEPLSVRIDAEHLAASAVVLATGRYLTGALTDRGGVRFALADLPLSQTVPENPLVGLRHEGPYDANVFRTGLRCDAAQHVLGLDGQPLHHRLYAVGDVQGGEDTLIANDATGRCLRGAVRAARALATGLGVQKAVG